MIRHVVNLLLWLLPPSRLFSVRRMCLRLAGVDIAADAQVCGRGWIYGRGHFSVGQGTWLSPGVIVFTHAEVPIEIGARCDIGPNVELITGSHQIGDATRRAGAGLARPISIGEGCWIGAGSRILGGVVVGAGTVVAAGAVVVADLPANVLAAGVPAIVKRLLP